MGNTRPRNPGLDVIRCTALICVVAVHFFLNTEFYKLPVTGRGMMAMTVIRSSLMVCVPLFLMLTGYLVRSRDTSARYYIKLVRILFVYAAASFLCAGYKVFFRNDDLNLTGAVAGIFDFTTAPYSWYIEMYIGLFLLTPFLNVLYDGLETKTRKQTLILTFLILTAGPSVFNAFPLDSPGWWLEPRKYTDHMLLVPDWWKQLYPITYFFLGRYLREYPLTWKPGKHLALTGTVFLLCGVYNVYRSWGGTFLKGPWQDYGSILIITQTVLVFSLLAGFRYDKMPAAVAKLISKISELSLGAYLCSWVFDQMIYPRLNATGLSMTEKWLWSPVIVAAILTGSLVAAWMIDGVYCVTVKPLVDRYLSKTSR